MFTPTVLLIYHNDQKKTLIQTTLQENDIQIVALKAEKDIIFFVSEQSPPQFLIKHNIHLILIEPGDDDLSECLTLIEFLKGNLLVGPIPILVFGSKEAVFRCEAYKKGAIGMVSSSCGAEELIPLIKAIFYQMEILKPKHSATGLASEPRIEQEINRRLERQESLSVACLTANFIDFFRDKYGFDMMDEVIRELAMIILVAIHDLGAEDDFVGQMDFNTFILVTKPERIETLCQEIIEVFEKDFKLLHYNEEDRMNGYMIYTGRRGEIRQIPFISLAIGISSNEKRLIFSSPQALHIAREVQRKALNSTKSEYVKDQRIEGLDRSG